MAQPVMETSDQPALNLSNHILNPTPSPCPPNPPSSKLLLWAISKTDVRNKPSLTGLSMAPSVSHDIRW